jgi:hypothetical protein
MNLWTFIFIIDLNTVTKEAFEEKWKILMKVAVFSAFAWDNRQKKTMIHIYEKY